MSIRNAIPRDRSQPLESRVSSTSTLSLHTPEVSKLVLQYYAGPKRPPSIAFVELCFWSTSLLYKDATPNDN
jgi:hypothetical protein